MSKQTEKIKELVAKREQAYLGGGQKAIDKQHARGKYTARGHAKRRTRYLYERLGRGANPGRYFRTRRIWRDI